MQRLVTCKQWFRVPARAAAASRTPPVHLCQMEGRRVRLKDEETKLRRRFELRKGLNVREEDEMGGSRSKGEGKKGRRLKKERRRKQMAFIVLGRGREERDKGMFTQRNLPLPTLPPLRILASNQWWRSRPNVSDLAEALTHN